MQAVIDAGHSYSLADTRPPGEYD